MTRMPAKAPRPASDGLFVAVAAGCFMERLFKVMAGISATLPVNGQSCEWCRRAETRARPRQRCRSSSFLPACRRKRPDVRQPGDTLRYPGVKTAHHRLSGVLGGAHQLMVANGPVVNQLAVAGNACDRYASLFVVHFHVIKVSAIGLPGIGHGDQGHVVHVGAVGAGNELLAQRRFFFAEPKADDALQRPYRFRAGIEWVAHRVYFKCRDMFAIMQQPKPETVIVVFQLNADFSIFYLQSEEERRVGKECR